MEGADKEKLSEHLWKLLNPTGTGIMGSLDIPKIGAELPIYHGTDEEVLSKGIGHLPGSSLPVGGKSTHSVLTGHRGLPQSKLLTRLDEMEKGDYFFLHVQGETMAYKVSEIQVVKPEEIEVLEIQEGEDLCSVITCTPLRDQYAPAHRDRGQHPMKQRKQLRWRRRSHPQGKCCLPCFRWHGF